MRKINSTFKTAFISEAGAALKKAMSQQTVDK